MEEQEEQTILLDEEIFILHQKKAIYFNDGTLSLEFLRYELLSKKETDEYYGFSLIFSEKKNGRWYCIDDTLKIHYWKSLTSINRPKISYPLREFYDGAEEYGYVTIMDIKDDAKDFILYLKICNTENKSFHL